MGASRVRSQGDALGPSGDAIGVLSVSLFLFLSLALLSLALCLCLALLGPHNGVVDGPAVAPFRDYRPLHDAKVLARLPH